MANAPSGKRIGIEALLRRVTEHLQGRSPFDEAPLRAEVFSVAQLVLHAKALAENQSVVTQRGSNRLLARLGENEQLLRAYNRTTHLPERKKMMQAWADYLDKLKAGAEIIPFRAAVA